jgi:SAM-dependent methyltransferase
MNSFDEIWNDIYERGHVNRYPWDSVVSFVFRNHPRNKSRDEIHVLELGCGAGNNLLFCAKEGFQVTGVDASSRALEFAVERFNQERVHGDFLNEDFTKLSLENGSVDLVIDRASLTCTPLTIISQALAEAHRVLKPGGRLLFVPYADSHSSASSGEFDPASRVVREITAGTLVGVGQISFLSINDIRALFDEAFWRFVQIERAETVNLLQPIFPVHAEYRVVVEKTRDLHE